MLVAVVILCFPSCTSQTENLSNRSNEELIEEAATFIQQDQYDQAEKRYRQLLVREPKNVEYLLQYGLITTRLGERKSAIEAFSHALKIQPENEQALLGLAFAYLFDSQFETSKALILEILNRSPDNSEALAGLGFISALMAKEGGAKSEADGTSPPAEESQPPAPPDTTTPVVDHLLDLGKLYMGMSRYAEAIDVYNRALKLQPDRQDVRLALAAAELANGDPDSSNDLYSNILAEDPHNAEALAGLGRIAFQQGNLGDAEKLSNDALGINPHDVTALQTLAQLRMQQNRYTDAQKLYEQAGEVEPENPEIKKGLAESKEKPQLENADKLDKEKRYREEAAIYEKLVEESPYNVDYLAKLASVYVKLDRNQAAIELYNRALHLEPDRQDIRVALGFAYLREKELPRSQELFEEALKEEPDNTEALAGMGRIATLNGDDAVAEEYFEKALSTAAEDTTTLYFLGLFRMHQKRYAEAEHIFAKLLAIDPTDPDFKEGLRRAHDAPALETARSMEENKNYSEAAAIYQELISNSPETADYYIMLGRVYISMEQKDDAIAAYSEGLEAIPGNKELLRALGFAYLYKAYDEDAVNGDLEFRWYYPFIFRACKENLTSSQGYFLAVLEKDPKDVESLAGLGRIAALDGCLELAEGYYYEALSIDPEDRVALSFYAGLEAQEGHNFTARDYYAYLSESEPSDEDSKKSYRDTLDGTQPAVDIGGFYHEEDEKDQILDVQDARLKDYGAALDIFYPVNDCLRLSGRIVDEYLILQDLLNDTTQYSLSIQRIGLNFNWNYNPYITIYGGFGTSYFARYQHPTFIMREGLLVEPALGVSYNKNHHTLIAEILSDSPIVSRDFDDNHARLVERHLLHGSYEYDFGKRRLFGIEAANVWYIEPLHNQQQIGSTWLQLTPPKYWENISFRYQFVYGRFNKLTVNYYTYQDQTTHWLKLQLNKNWYDDRIYTEVGYAHAWQRSFESGQIIQITPVAVFHFVHREIDAAYGIIKAKFNDCTSFTLSGDYSHDTFDYNTWTIAGTLHWRF